MDDTIERVGSPSSLLIDNKTVKLAGINASGLTVGQYNYLMNDLNDWLLGKEVFVKDDYVYFNLGSSYNSISINEMIQNDIKKLIEGPAFGYYSRNFWNCYSRGYY